MTVSHLKKRAMAPEAKTERRAAIVRAAEALSSQDVACSMDSLARKCGLAKGTLYLYFPSKEALYLGILSDGLETVSKRYQATNDTRQDVAARLRRAIEVSIQFYDERRDLLRLIATEEPRLAEARNRLIQTWRERGFIFFTTLIEEGMSTGVFGHTDSRAATLAILGGIRSVLLYYGTTRPAQSISEELGDFFLKGLVARERSNHRAEQRQ